MVIPPADPQMLANSLSMILNKNWQHVPAKATSFAKRYAAEVVAKELIELYKDILH